LTCKSYVAVYRHTGGCVKNGDMVWLRLQNILLEDLGVAKEGGETIE
jgi:hypothetical protein